MWILRISASKLFTFFTLEKRHFAPHLLIDTILANCFYNNCTRNALRLSDAWKPERCFFHENDILEQK